MDRRSFLRAWAGLGAGGALGFSLRESGPALDRVGLELYTVRGLMARDFEGTLARVAEIGYREVEFAGYHGRSPKEAGRVAREAGLDPVSAHVPLAEVVDGPEALLDGAQAAGHRHVVLAWIDAERRRTLDDWRRLAEIATRFGARCRERGLRFGFHNHAYGFAPSQGRVPYEVFVETSDPDLVGLQLDLYWLRAAGRDPLDAVRRYGGRVLSCHVKDMDADGRMVDVGVGVMDFRSILAAARRAGVKHFFVEHDEPPDPLASISRSYGYVRSLEVEP